MKRTKVDKRTVLLWGIPEEPPLALVWRALDELGVNVAFLDQNRVFDTEIEVFVDLNLSALLRVGDQELDLEMVTSVYPRPYAIDQLPCVAKHSLDSNERAYAVNFHDIFLSWMEITDAIIVNRPNLMASNASKPYQLAKIKEAGFEIPDTIVTTDREAVLEFWKRHREIIYKSVSGVRSIVQRMTPEYLDRLDDIRWCPTQFQQYIAGTDVRVHVVGMDIFACEILSEADDYRYAGQQGSGVSIQTCGVPEEIAQRCITITRSLQLSLSGIDLRRTDDGKWYCLEVNTSPGFSWFQEATGQPIDRAIAKLLSS